MPGSELEQPARSVGVVEDPLLDRVVRAARHQHRLAEEEVRLGHAPVVRARHDRPKPPFLQVPHGNRAAVAADCDQGVLVPGCEGQ